MILEYISAVSDLIFSLKKQLIKDEEKLSEITKNYLESKDSGLLEQLQRQKRLISERYKQLSAYYKDQSIKYLELSALENDDDTKVGYLRFASEKMRLSEEATTQAQLILESDKS